MTTPAVAIVIPVFNDSLTLLACVRSVIAHTDLTDVPVLVIDDGSTDRGTEILAQFPQVRVIRRPRGGVAAALNAGFAAAPDRDIVRLHADVVIETADWLPKLIKAAYAHARAGVVGVRLVYPDGRIHSEGRHFISGFGMHAMHSTRRQFQPDGAVGKIHEVDAVPGALAYYRREVIAATGGLDANYGAAWLEDDDFCVAARRHNFKVYVHAGVKAVHFTRAQSPLARPLIPEAEGEITKLTSTLKLASQRIQAEYWEQKWGWHPLYPDLGEIRRLYGDTEICWQIGEPLRYRSSEATPTVDCCIVTCNTLPLLKRCLESLAITDYPAGQIHVYITDNASNDGTAEYLAGIAPSFPFTLHHLRFEVNTGCPVGMNFAVMAGRSELVARLDDDIVLPANWLRVMVQDFQQRPFAGCIGPKIINDDDRHTIQCGPYRHFPNIYGHEDETDHGQADYVARTTHVRGCCNLYRRDVFTKAALFDARFSPTQFDDPDHHLALLQAGYEIIYDGRVSVVHKLNNGLARSFAAVSNQKANHAKFQGKWGTDIWEVVERGIELSREGRYLPDHGDTSAWLALGPSGEFFPRPIPAHPRRHAALLASYEELARADLDQQVARWVSEYITHAAHLRRNQCARLGLELLHHASNFAPTRVDVLAALANAYIALGQSAFARTIAQRGLWLQPDHAELLALAQPSQSAELAHASGVVQRLNQIGESSVTIEVAHTSTEVSSITTSASGLRVLMVNTFEERLSGGDMHQLKKTRQYLQRLGVHVDICCAPRPDPRGYDVVHLWNSWFPAQTLGQIKAIRAQHPDMPVVHTPIFWDMREKCWADSVIPSVFAQSPNAAVLDERLALIANDKYAFQGRTRNQARESNYRGYDAYQRAIFPLVDHLLPQSRAEIANLKKVHGVEKPFSLVPNGAETEVFDRATPDWFVQTYDMQDFVLIVGLVETRKNQLMLLHALRDTGLPVVVIGNHYDRQYHALCQHHAPKNTIFIDHLPHEQLASAFKAAKVHALPSWMECAAFANVEAALCGCALVVSDRTSEREYFGANAYYCDPANIVSIRNAVVQAHRNHAADAPKRTRLIAQFRHDFTWTRAATATLAGYEAAIAKRRSRAAA